MKQERKIYARYPIIRGHNTLWKGDPTEEGSQFRQVIITSDQFNSTQGLFQVYALEGIGKGVKDGKFAGSEANPKILFDEDFPDLFAAGDKFDQIVKDSFTKGFEPHTLFNEMQLQAKLRR